MSYYNRQKRLNHYFFSCKCEACFKDAQNGLNLRCIQCSGPVVFNSALNEVPSLNGNCLLCYSKYENFEQTISQFTNLRQSIKSLKSIGLLIKKTDKPYICGIIDSLHKIVNLSLPCSTEVGQSMIECSNSIENFGKQINLPLADKLNLALFMNRHMVNHLQKKDKKS